MNGITASDIARFDMLAGPDRMWDEVTGCHRPPSDVRRALRADIAERQGGVCPVCGNAIEFGQFNHVVSRGPKVKGFIPGVVFVGCAPCNLRCAYLYGEVTDDGRVVDGGVIPFDGLARPDVIPTEWTPFPILRTRSR